MAHIRHRNLPIPSRSLLTPDLSFVCSGFKVQGLGFRVYGFVN